MLEVPNYGLRSYALFFSKHGTREAFKQSELDWIVSPSMRKKIFSVLLNAGWIKKISRQEYQCIPPGKIFQHLLDFKVPDIIKLAEKPYAFTGLSAIELWSDFSYVLRGRERSPYFIKILKNDIAYWKGFFSQYNIPTYIDEGSMVGEFVILMPVGRIKSVKLWNLWVEPLKNVRDIIRTNKMFAYAGEYINKKYGAGDE